MAQPTIPPVQGPTGNIYQVFYEPGLTWAEAYRLAGEQKIGGIRGHLVTITSRVEDLFVKDIILLPVYERRLTYWAGGYRPLEETNGCQGWLWLNDEGPTRPRIRWRTASTTPRFVPEGM